jgi:hypothetical protein
MPKDNWRNATDRRHQCRARQQYAEFGHLVSYESVYDGDWVPKGEEIVEETEKAYRHLNWADFLTAIAAKEPNERLAALEHIKDQPDWHSRVLPHLLEALDDPSEQVRYRAARAVTEIGPLGVAALPALRLRCRATTGRFKTVLSQVVAKLATTPRKPEKKQRKRQKSAIKRQNSPTERRTRR